MATSALIYFYNQLAYKQVAHGSKIVEQLSGFGHLERSSNEKSVEGNYGNIAGKSLREARSLHHFTYFLGNFFNFSQP